MSFATYEQARDYVINNEYAPFSNPKCLLEGLVNYRGSGRQRFEKGFMKHLKYVIAKIQRLMLQYGVQKDSILSHNIDCPSVVASNQTTKQPRSALMQYEKEVSAPIKLDKYQSEEKAREVLHRIEEKKRLKEQRVREEEERLAVIQAEQERNARAAQEALAEEEAVALRMQKQMDTLLQDEHDDEEQETEEGRPWTTTVKSTNSNNNNNKSEWSITHEKTIQHQQQLISQPFSLWNHPIMTPGLLGSPSVSIKKQEIVVINDQHVSAIPIVSPVISQLEDEYVQEGMVLNEANDNNVSKCEKIISAVVIASPEQDHVQVVVDVPVLLSSAMELFMKHCFGVNEYHKYLAMFMEQEIDITQLTDLTEQDLNEIGLKTIGSRLKFKKGLQSFQFV